MKSWFIILIGLVGSWYYIDLSSDNGFYSLALPILFFLFLISVVIKVAVKIGPDGGHSSSGGDIGSGGFGGGSDSGGGGDC